jgi:hypothetical protein
MLLSVIERMSVHKLSARAPSSRIQVARGGGRLHDHPAAGNRSGYCNLSTRDEYQAIIEMLGEGCRSSGWMQHLINYLQSTSIASIGN